MGILSLQNLFSNAQAITATAVSTNIIDLGAAGTPYGAAAALNGDVGAGARIPLFFVVTEAFNTLTSLAVALEMSASSDLSSSTVLSTQSIALASLVVGKRLNLTVLPQNITQRYLGMRYTVTGSNPSTGKITSGIGFNQTNITGA